MLSLGIDASRAFAIASASAGLPSGSPPPSFAATVIARVSLVKSLPRRASTIAFLCLIPAHFECPAMGLSLATHCVVQPLVGGCAALGGEVPGTGAAGCGIGLGHGAAECRGEPFRVVSREGLADAGAVVELCGRPDRRRPAGHRLHEHQPERL